MKGTNKKIQMHFEGLVNELKKIGGECVIVWHDYKTDTGGDAVAVLTPDTATALLVELLSRNPYLIPRALTALAIVADDFDFEGDDDSDDDDDDDDDDDPDEDPVDVSPVVLEACMN